MKSYFENIENLSELRKEYKRLVLKYHPDRGGDTRTMQDINTEFDTRFEQLKAVENSNNGNHKVTETPEKFRKILDILLHLSGITVELCGSWLWIDGETYPHRQALKEAGCRWSRNKKKWYWRHAEDSQKWYPRKAATMEKIRETYGSQVFTVKESDLVKA